LCIALFSLITVFAQEGEWTTFRGDLQRTAFYNSFPSKPLKLVWRREFWQELTGPRAEVIVADGLAFMGTYGGNFYALDSNTGETRWYYKTGGPIGHTAAYNNGVVFFGSMDCNLYAVFANNGKLKWSFEAEEGIWVSPTICKGNVMFGDRAGNFFALDELSGRLKWKFKTGDRILTTGAVTEDEKYVIFASEDMYLYCLRIEDGSLVWKSRKLQGLSVRDYSPVIFSNLVFITTNPVKDFHTILGENEQMLVKRTGFTGKDPRYIPGTPEDVQKEQEFIVEFLKKNPSEQTFYAFKISDGKEPWIAPILYTGGLHNPLTPPCVNKKTGEVFVHVRSAYGTWDGGGEVRSYTGFGKLNILTGRVTLIDPAYPSKEPGRPPGAKDRPWMTFNYIGDETQTLSCSPSMLICNHQGFIGALDLNTLLTQRLYGKRDTYGGFYGPGNFGWENQGGIQKAKSVGQPFGIVNEWHGPARSIASVAGKKVFYNVGSQVLCLEEQ
jgi:outer membrane protein assembly factor BamB